MPVCCTSAPGKEKIQRTETGGSLYAAHEKIEQRLGEQDHLDAAENHRIGNILVLL